MGHSETIWHAQPKNLILAEVFHMFQNCKILYRLSEEKNLKQSVLKIPGGGPKRFDASTCVFYIVGECISCAADTHLATDLTCKYYSFHEDCPIFARHRWCWAWVLGCAL